MGAPDSFAELIRRLRAGDARAAEELVRKYEPAIRVEVRVWLRTRHPGLRRAFDSLDICQAVLGSFFLRVSAGLYELDRPEQLTRLLLGMARKKLIDQVKFQQRKRRDIRRVRSMRPEHEEVSKVVDSPSDVVAGEELLTAFRKRLSAEERQLADLRCQGLGWEAIAAEVDGTPEARRKQLNRAVDRVLQELGMEELRPD
jgi:RNA polymerase sigma-70 factor (ECF subfamily)